MRGLLSLDQWTEVVQIYLRQPLRTALTAFSVAWGVFMLVMLLGAGQGLENNLRWSFRDDAINSIWIRGGKTSLAWQGQPEVRDIQLTDDDVALVRALPEAGRVAARWYPASDTRVAVGSRVSTFDIRSTHPDHQYVEGTVVRAGRFLNDRDIAGRRKVTVLGRRVAEFLFPGEDPFEAPLGQTVRVGGIAFTVVGVFTDDGGEREEQLLYLPITTTRAAFGGRQNVDWVMFTVGSSEIDDASVEAADRAVASIREGLAGLHHFNPKDRGAARIRDLVHDYADVKNVFVWLRAFSWVVGLGTVFAAMVGVGNILLISVKERTRELGLRKALGARSGDLLGMVLQEALLLTTAAGWMGLIAGLGLLEAVRRFVPPNDYLRDPDVDLPSVLLATLALVLAGGVAGLVPAWQAARVAPVVALQDE